MSIESGDQFFLPLQKNASFVKAKTRTLKDKLIEEAEICGNSTKLCGPCVYQNVPVLLFFKTFRITGRGAKRDNTLTRLASV
jgi:hypothetical protein